MENELLYSPGKFLGVCHDLQVGYRCVCMWEPIVDNVHVVIIIQAAKVLPSNTLHLIGKLKAIFAILNKNNRHFVGPLIDEQQSSPDVNSIVSGKSNLIVNKRSVIRK